MVEAGSIMESRIETKEQESLEPMSNELMDTENSLEPNMNILDPTNINSAVKQMMTPVNVPDDMVKKMMEETDKNEKEK